MADAAEIGPEYFGLDFTIDTSKPAPWPEIRPGAARLSVAWAWIERSPGSYTWRDMDARVATAEANGSKPLLVVWGTPHFHAIGAAATASPPYLAAYRDFVLALVSRYGERVDYQVWNEPNVPIFFTGTPNHMGRMTRIFGKAVDETAPDAVVVAPSFPLRVESNRRWFRLYWSQRVGRTRVGNFVDAASISAYPMPDGDPEDGLAITRWAHRTVESYGFEGPIWVSEINYGANSLQPTAPIPARLQAAYVVRTYVLHAAGGAERVYWWQWEPHVTVNTNLQDGSGRLTSAGRAYGLVRDWLLETQARGCSVDEGGVYSCIFQAHRGVRRYIYWQREGKLRSVTAPVGATMKTNSRGVSSSLRAGDEFRAGASPVMVEVRGRR